MMARILKSTVLALALLGGAARAEATADDQAWYERWWNTAKTETTSIVRDGGWDLYFPAVEYHMPWAYDSEQREKYNQSPMPALGIGRGQYLDNGNWQGLYVMGFRDSNDFASWMAGYSYRWLWDLPGGAYGGLGATAFIMARENYGDYTPFPAVLPMASIGYKHVSAELAYVPGFKKGTGNVLFLWFKLEEKGRPGS